MSDENNFKALSDKPEKVKRLVRDENQRKVFDKVFTEYSLTTLYSLSEKKLFKYIEYPISTGKEGNVFRAEDYNNQFLAIKIYKILTSNFNNMQNYIVGDNRFKKTKKSRKDIIFTWTQKEYKNLERMNKAKVRVPIPIAFQKNILVMELVGVNGEPAKRLKDVKVKDIDYIYEKIVEYIARMVYVAKLVHSDLSEFNILVEEKDDHQEPIIIDCGQAVLLTHPKASEFYERDIANMASYFKKKGIDTSPEKLKEQIKAWKEKLKNEWFNMETSILIPKDRIAVVIGAAGKTKKDLERKGGVKLIVDSENNEVAIESTKDTKPLDFLSTSNVIKAIGRGFSPENASLLFDDEYYFDQIDITDYVGKSDKALLNKKGRIIGKRGKSREEIERQTKTLISVYGKTVSMIGKAEDIRTARKCIEMLLEGARHATVYKFLDKQKERPDVDEIDI